MYITETEIYKQPMYNSYKHYDVFVGIIYTSLYTLLSVKHTKDIRLTARHMQIEMYNRHIQMIMSSRQPDILCMFY